MSSNPSSHLLNGSSTDPVSILSDIIVWMKYARFRRDLGRRETWDEIIERNKDMHKRRFPQHTQMIDMYFDNYVKTKKVLPSMRSLQFAGPAAERHNSRIFNCAYLPVDSVESFSEVMFLLLGGTGVGYSVQKRHTTKLPPVVQASFFHPKLFVVPDSIEGWADAVKFLLMGYVGDEIYYPEFDFSKIREKGMELITAGGRAPGPEPLIACIDLIRGVLKSTTPGSRLTPLQAHDIMCFIGDAVLSGGIRRAALISGFDIDDEEMLTCKRGDWWVDNPQRARANNSVILDRSETTREQFYEVWERIRESGCGEPGFYWTNDKDWFTNPCCEISLQPYQFCNLTEINASNIENKADFVDRALAANFIGTLQASYTDFSYLRPKWKETTESEALTGIGITGIASNRIQELSINLRGAAEIMGPANRFFSSLFGIKQAARLTCVKPAGTTSLTLGTSSGIHAWHSRFYIRRIRVNKNEAIYSYIRDFHPEMIEDCLFGPEHTAVISVPQKAPLGSVLREEESATELLGRVRQFSLEWVRPGSLSGSNTNNVSATITIRDGEWDEVRDWMWENRFDYNGLSVLPFDGGSYSQAPFEEISEERYQDTVAHIHRIDLSMVREEQDNTDLQHELACNGGACEI